MSTAWLQVQNNSHDVLAADVLAGDATIEVTTAATQFPAAYPYRVTVWDAATHIDPGDDPNMEIMQVTSRAGNVLGVTRAQEGTAAAAHTTGDVVRLLVTAGMVDQIHDTIDAHDHSAAGDGGTVSHVELANIGSNTHAQIDTHIGAANPHSGSASTGDLLAHTGDTSNPHSVTAAQTGAATAQWNANQIQGTSVDAAGIADGKVLKYSSASGKLEYETDNDTTDHGALSGLGDDDHAQYHTDARALTWLGTRSTTDLPEGTGLYHTTARARAAVSATTPLAYDSNTGIFSIQQATALADGYLSAADWTTFDAKQSALTLPLTHENGGLETDVSAYAGLLKISGGVTSEIVDNSAAWDAAAGLAHAAATVLDTASVDMSITGQQISAAVLPAGVDHDALLNYSADRHFLQTSIDHVSTGLATGLLKVTTGTGALSVAEALDLPTHATRHESGGGDQVNHDSLTGFVANEHIDWTDASSDLKTTGHGALGQTAVTAGTVLGVAELFCQTSGDVRGIAVDTTLEPAGPLTGPLRNYALSFNAKWNTAQDGSLNGLLYGILGNTETAAGAPGDLFRMSAIRASSWHCGSGNVGQMDVVYSLLRNDGGSTQDGDITAGYNYFAAAYTNKASGRIGTRYGYYAADITGGGLCTTQYGLYVESLAGATTNRAVWLAGTGSTNGIWMGEDVVLYRDSANVLKTDDALHIAGSGITFPASAATINGSGGWLKVESGTTLYLQYDNPTKAVNIGRSGNNLAATVFGGLTVTSTTLPFIPPRMTTVQRDAIASPSAGMVIYNSTTNVLNFYNGSGWGAV